MKQTQNCSNLFQDFSAEVQTSKVMNYESPEKPSRFRRRRKKSRPNRRKRKHMANQHFQCLNCLNFQKARVQGKIA